MGWDVDYSSLSDILPLEGNIVTAMYVEKPIEGNLIRANRICAAIGLARTGAIMNINGPGSETCGGAYYCGLAAAPHKNSLRDKLQRNIFASSDAAERDKNRRLHVPYDPRKYLVLAPLQKTKFNPDVVVLFGNSIQVHDLIRLASYANTDVNISLNRWGICQSAIAGALVTGDIMIGFMRGIPYNILDSKRNERLVNYKPEEIIVGMPTRWFLTIVDNYREIKKRGSSSSG
ncbi:MAG: DUF169 domain-containing protein [Chloroflexi bacterium]|nr:DUF169 domain-containing protein [Chloroflexota bacterium]